MNILNRLWKKYLNFNKRSREALKITRSIKTSFKCPKCKSPLFKIAYSNSYDPQYFCKKCNYEGMAKL